MASIDWFRAKIETMVWVISAVLTVFGVFRAGELYSSVKNDLDTTRRAAHFAETMLETQAQIIERLERLEFAQRMDSKKFSGIQSKLNNSLHIRDLDAESGE